MPPQKRKRGRPAAGASSQDASQPDDTTAQRPRKRARASPQQSEEQSSRVKNKVSRSTTARTTATTPKGGAGQSRRRSSLQEVQPDEAQNQGTESAKGGRKKRMPAAADNDAQEEAAPKKRGPKPRAVASPGTARSSKRRSSANQQSPQQTSQPARRRSSSTAPETEEQPPSPPKPYPHVAQRTRRIRRSHITAKWSPLAPPSLSAANTLLTLAHRPILTRLSSTTQRRQHTFAALQLITKRINRRLARGIPFPPSSGAEVELDFEGVLDGKARLERQLDPALHAVELLRREKKRVEEELERDYETLRNLEAGARGQAREQRDLLKKAHDLAPGPKTEAQGDDTVVFKTEEKASGPLFTDLDGDHEMKAVVTQLGGHVESMRANVAQADGLAEKMGRSRAALRGVLMRSLTGEQYERVVMG